MKIYKINNLKNIFLIALMFTAVMMVSTCFLLGKQSSDSHSLDQKPTTSRTSGFADEVLNPTESYDYIDPTDYDEEPDPLEPINRVIFEFNYILDGILIRPIASLYKLTVIDDAQIGVRNFVDNILSPISLINFALQGDGEKAFETVFRFLINSTIGILGLFDVAKEIGLPNNKTTFNETLSSYNIETGPYLVLPILGPSSFRDAVGKVGDMFMNPLYYIARNAHQTHNKHRQQRSLLYALYGLEALNFRVDILKNYDDLQRTSSDFYVAIRSVFFQKQMALMNKSR